jgi:hypothetical protein
LWPPALWTTYFGAGGFFFSSGKDGMDQIETIFCVHLDEPKAGDPHTIGFFTDRQLAEKTRDGWNAANPHYLCHVWDYPANILLADNVC